jgi:hypothetical protein
MIPIIQEIKVRLTTRVTSNYKASGRVWCDTSVIPTLGRLRQENCEFEAAWAIQ